MSNKRITDLTELTNPTTDDVFPVVDIATNTTTKVQLANLPVQTAVTTALATKQDTLVSGTNIKTVNSTSLVGSGNVAVQPTLVSGTNIKTLNSVSLLGAGDIVLAATPSGVSGAIQFSNGSAFASDAANLFWDDTNNRLGIGTNTPTAPLTIKGVTNTGTILLSLENSTRKIIDISDRGVITANAYNSANNIYTLGFGGAFDAGALTLFGEANANGVFLAGKSDLNNYIIPNLGLGIAVPTAKVHIKGSGSTSATTSLLVQNSAGQMALQVTDDRNVAIGNRLNLNGTFDQIYAQSSAQIAVRGYHGLQVSRGTGVTSTMFEVYDEATTTGGLLVNVRNTPFANMLTVNYLGQMALGTASPNASAQFQINSTTRGFLPPVMTTTQKNAISAIAGLVVYDSTTNKLCCYNGSTWNDLF
jgi:hypothetical protein